MSGPRISKLDRLPRFDRAFNKLDQRIQHEVKQAIADLLKHPIPNGRRVHKMGGQADIWEVRINRNFRLSFKLDGDTAVLRNVDSHDSLLGNP